jgi:hypothetical protein
LKKDGNEMTPGSTNTMKKPSYIKNILIIIIILFIALTFNMCILIEKQYNYKYTKIFKEGYFVSAYFEGTDRATFYSDIRSEPYRLQILFEGIEGNFLTDVEITDVSLIDNLNGTMVPVSLSKLNQSKFKSQPSKGYDFYEYYGLNFPYNDMVLKLGYRMLLNGEKVNGNVEILIKTDYNCKTRNKIWVIMSGI